jgi:tripartite-type tricarboxylate transporter receptor subunit TctC
MVGCLRVAIRGLEMKKFLLGVLCCLSIAVAQAQSNVIKMIVAFPPGGPVDSMARSLVEPLGKDLNAQIVIENKPGGNGAIAAEYLAANPADGKTIWFTSAGAVAINPGLYEKLAYNPIKDLAAVSLVANNVEVLVVNPASPANNAVEFIALAKKGDLTMGSSGTGSVPHLALEQLNDSANVKILHVPYKGAAPAITDVMAGHVDGFFGDIPGLISYIRSGKLKPIGLAADKRNSAIPDVKTFNEIGIKGVDTNNWYAVFVKVGTPKSDIDRLSASIKKVVKQDPLNSKLMQSGSEPVGSSPEELSAILKKDIAKWTQLIKTKKISPE